MRGIARAAGFACVLWSIGALAQNGAAPQVQPAPGGVMIINSPAPPTQEKDPCAPLHASLDKDRCDSMIAPTRRIVLTPGERRVLHFDRAYYKIDVDSDPPDGVVSVTPAGENSSRPGPAGINTAVVLDPKGPGEARMIVYGEGFLSRNGAQMKDIMLSAMIVVRTEPTTEVRIINGMDFARKSYDCGETECDFDARRSSAGRRR